MRRGILLCDRYHQPQVRQHEGVTGRFVFAAMPANIDQPSRQRFGGFTGEPDQAASSLRASLDACVDGRGIQHLELHHGIGHPCCEVRQSSHRLFQQNALELELLKLTCGRTAATQKQLPGFFPPFGRLLSIASDPKIPTILAQRPLQNFYARLERSNASCRAAASIPCTSTTWSIRNLCWAAFRAAAKTTRKE